MNLATQLRLLAREFERTSHASVSHSEIGAKTEYSCVAINQCIGYGTRRAYERAFDLPGGNDKEVWYVDGHLYSPRPLEDRTDLRVLMLCFAAAMAETGDL